MVVGAVERSGGVADYSQGMPAELTVSAAGTVWCASRDGLSAVQEEGTSFGEPLSMQIPLTSEDDQLLLLLPVSPHISCHWTNTEYHF